VDFSQAKARVQELSARLMELQDAYYRDDALLVPDAQYDELLR
jgi:NAD-dependent DNA ligase